MSEKVHISNIVRTIERNRRLSLGLPVPLIRSEIPIGYKQNPDNENEAIVDEEKFKLLIQARKYLSDSPFIAVAEWLAKAGLSISHAGLHKLMKQRPPYTDDERNSYNPTGNTEEATS